MGRDVNAGDILAPSSFGQREIVVLIDQKPLFDSSKPRFERWQLTQTTDDREHSRRMAVWQRDVRCSVRLDWPGPTDEGPQRPGF